MSDASWQYSTKKWHWNVSFCIYNTIHHFIKYCYKRIKNLTLPIWWWDWSVFWPPENYSLESPASMRQGKTNLDLRPAEDATLPSFLSQMGHVWPRPLSAPWQRLTWQHKDHIPGGIDWLGWCYVPIGSVKKQMKNKGKETKIQGVCVVVCMFSEYISLYCSSKCQKKNLCNCHIMLRW